MKKTIWRICTKVFATNVAKQLNWCGRGDKRGIRKTNLGALIIGMSKINTFMISETCFVCCNYIFQSEYIYIFLF